MPLRLHVDRADVRPPVSVPVQHEQRHLRGQGRIGRGLRRAVDSGNRVRGRIHRFTRFQLPVNPGPALARSTLRDDVSRLRPRNVPGRRHVSVRLRVHMARPARGGERRRVQRSGFTVSVDGGVFRRKRVRAAVPHVRGEAPVQSKRRARERDVRVARSGVRRRHPTLDGRGRENRRRIRLSRKPRRRRQRHAAVFIARERRRDARHAVVRDGVLHLVRGRGGVRSERVREADVQ
mmetsp:Transcript_14940/g.53797  ORF Transcript_14940/g.53797 Transcript_14940/m.53797 type:complete len:235 (-) Transcript_14940:1797-2501(-)